MSVPQTRQRDPRSADLGSRTITISPTESDDAGPSSRREVPIGVLRLRGAPSRRPKVQFTEETIDNEGMGKKKSKSESRPDPIISWRQKRLSHAAHAHASLLHIPQTAGIRRVVL